MKCQCCREEQASLSWQPFGPGENAKTFTLPGNHYRGFPVIKVGEQCKSAIEAGKRILFSYKGFRYIYQDGKVQESKPSLWDGGTSVFNGESATMIMKDTPEGSELVAMVCDSEFIQPFIATPDLIEACELIIQAFPNYNNLLSGQQAMAIARIHNALHAAKE